MSKEPKLNFPAIRLRAKRCGETVLVWDALRGLYLVLTPEEWVRRHLIEFLTSHCGVQPTRIVQEYPVRLNGQPQRADVVVCDDAGAPLILAECKAADVVIDNAVLAQAVRYNSVVAARYLILTNGLDHFCYEFVDGRYTPISQFPKL